jgi:DNA adenine methylase
MPATNRLNPARERATRRGETVLPVDVAVKPTAESARQVLRYPGGKAGIKEGIVRHFVPHTTYVEPFAGGASVLLHKPPSPVEYLNDLDGAVSDFFAILREGGEALDALIDAVEGTPYARVELARARRTLRQGDRSGKPAGRVEYNRCLLVTSWMSRMAFSHARASGWMSSKTQPRELDRWNRLPERLAQAARRLKGVFIENRPALHLLTHLDGPETLFYLDPPYPSAAGDRRPTGGNAYYRFDMSPEQHVELLDSVTGLVGKCLISGVRSRLYDNRLKGWHRVDLGEAIAGGRRRRECLWMNYAPPAQLTLWPTDSEDVLP